MKDMRFVQYDKEALQESIFTETIVAEDFTLAEAVEEFQKDCQSFRKKYSLIYSSKFFQEFKKNRTTIIQNQWKGYNYWRKLKDAFLLVADGRCPICGSDLSRYSDIDHYYPKKRYWWMAYEYENYLILCEPCNSSAKRTHFPFGRIKLEESTQSTFIPLLINPIYEDIFSYFELEFITRRKLCFVKPSKKLVKDSIEYQKAIATINIYDLNNKRVKANSSKKAIKPKTKLRSSITVKRYKNLIALVAQLLEKKTKEEVQELAKNRQHTANWETLIWKGQFSIS